MHPEQKFNRWLIDNVLVGMHYQRIESTVGSGIPDMNVCWEGHEFWLESKVGDPLLRPFQNAWISRRIQAGGKVIVICDMETTVHIYPRYGAVTPVGKYLKLVGPHTNIPKSGIIVRRILAQHLSIPMTF